MKLKIVYEESLRVDVDKVGQNIWKRVPKLFSKAELIETQLQEYVGVEDFQQHLIQIAQADWQNDILFGITHQPLYWASEFEIEGSQLFSGRTYTTGEMAEKDRPLLGGFVNLRGIKSKLKYNPDYLAKVFCSMLLALHYGWQNEHEKDCFFIPYNPHRDDDIKSPLSNQDLKELNKRRQQRNKEINYRNQQEFCQLCQELLASLTPENIHTFVETEVA